MSGIFNPRSKNARPLTGINDSAYRAGALGPRFRDGSLGLAGSVLPRYTPITSVLGALGAGVASSIPGQCWDVTGFKDCHATWFAQAQRDCQGGEVANFDGDMDACTSIYADQYAIQNCVPKFCPSTIAKKQTGGLTGAQVTTIQKACNTALAKNGFKTIPVDGVLGPATCGAASFLLQYGMSSVFKDYHMELYCTTFTNPTKVGSTVPMQTTVLQTIDANNPVTMPAWGQPDPNMAATQQSINRSLDASGYLPIAVTGVLDAPTCGAMRWMKDNMGQDLLAASGANCQAYTLPTKKPPSQSPGTAPRGSSPPGVAPPAPIPPGAHPISSATMLVGGLALAAAGGLYYYAKKKGMV